MSLESFAVKPQGIAYPVMTSCDRAGESTTQKHWQRPGLGPQICGLLVTIVLPYKSSAETEERYNTAPPVTAGRVETWVAKAPEARLASRAAAGCSPEQVQESVGAIFIYRKDGSKTRGARRAS